MIKVKYFLQNFIIDVFVQGILILNLLNIGETPVKNLCGAIPFLFFVLLIGGMLSLAAMAAADRNLFELSSEAKRKILEVPESDKGFLKIYNKITDFSCIVLLLLNGFYGSFLLFVGLKVCTNTTKEAIKNFKAKEAACVTETDRKRA